MKWIVNKITHRLTKNCYESIDTLPVFYWYKIHETNDLKYLVKGNSKPSKYKYIALGLLWKQISDEYVSRFGFSDDFLSIIRKRKEIARLKIQKIVKEDKSLNTFIKIAESELEKMIRAQQGDGNFFSGKPYMEKILGFRIDTMTTSVAEYMGYIESVKQMNKQAA